MGRVRGWGLEKSPESVKRGMLYTREKVTGIGR